MKATFIRLLLATALVLATAPQLGLLYAAPWDPAAADYAGHKGKTIYVSKKGDNSDGSSWQRAFHSIQAALLALPDNQGGHRVLIRPDTYVEANLYANHPGAPGSYNLLAGDRDGKLGSGASGWVVIDTGCPGVAVRTDPTRRSGNPTFKIIKSPLPESGLKCVDWWGASRCDPDRSSDDWDRWICRNLYVTGSEGGIGWCLTHPEGAPFSAVMEDCVGIGRFAGTCACGHVARKDEPIVFRRSYFANLDWWGDAGGVYVRAHEKSMPAYPDAIFEDCTIVSPDNALQVAYPSFNLYTRVKLKGCRLITLNFSQPVGTPGSGIICCDIDGKYLHVDLEDCTLMGYKLFGKSSLQSNKVQGTGTTDPSFTIKGRVQAYVQFQQSLPAGFERLGLWPVDVFAKLAPPQSPVDPAAEKKLTKLPEILGSLMENTPVLYQNRALLVLNFRDDSKKKTGNCKKDMYLFIRDLATGEELARLGEGHSFVSALVNGSELNIFASQGTDHDWMKSIYRFSSTDLKTWKRELAIPLEGSEHLFNSSVCRDEQGYLMAYESNLPLQWCFKFARSKDLTKWEKVPGLVFAGPNGKAMSACPALRYFKPYYYVIYTIESPGRNSWFPLLARSKNLETWELSPKNPLFTAAEGEGSNNSDVDLIELDGKTYVYYATGDQATWGHLKRAVYPGPMSAFFESYFPANANPVRISAKVK